MNNYDDVFEELTNSMYEIGKALTEAIVEAEASLSDSFKSISEGLNFIGRWYKATEIMVEKQFVFTDPLTDELIEKVLNTDNLEKLVETYYLENEHIHLHSLIERCKESLKGSNNYDLFVQSIETYENNRFQLACLGLFAITDALLSSVSHRVNTGFKRRLKTIKDEFDESTVFKPIEQQIISVSIALEKIENSIFADSDFHSDEPEQVNRHWALHGRSSRKYLLSDVIKVLLWIDALLYIQNFDIVENTEK